MNSSMLMILVRTYLAEPSFINLVSVHDYMRLLLSADTSHSIRRRVFRVRLFLFRHASNETAKTKFKVFASREYLLRFIRPSSPTRELDSPFRRAGFSNRAVASSAQLNRLEASTQR